MLASARPALLAGTSAKGEFHCTSCGYGVTIHRDLPRCPMCAGEAWQPTAWAPFTRTPTDRRGEAQ